MLITNILRQVVETFLVSASRYCSPACARADVCVPRSNRRSTEIFCRCQRTAAGRTLENVLAVRTSKKQMFCNCCCCKLSSCHRTTSYANHWMVNALLIAIITLCFGGIHTYFGVSSDLFFLRIFSNFCPLNWLLV